MASWYEEVARAEPKEPARADDREEPTPLGERCACGYPITWVKIEGKRSCPNCGRPINREEE